MHRALKYILLLCMLAACSQDPLPGGLLPPELLDVNAEVLEDGRVEFSCTMNDTQAVTDCGFIFSGESMEETILKAEVFDGRHFSAISPVILEGGMYEYSAFAGNGRKQIRLYGGTFSIDPDDPHVPDPPETPPTPPDGPKAMLLRVDSGSDGWVFLPLLGDVDVVIDWGDGAVEAIKGDYSSDEWTCHKYEPGNVFEIAVEGAVEAMCTESSLGKMPFPEKILAVGRWGNLGVSSYTAAFKYCSNLSEVAADTLGAFRHASVNAIFHSCKSLKSVPDSLFAWHDGTNLGGLFLGCESLESIPAHIFSKCGAASGFDSAFEDCKSIVSIPEGLFDDCPEAEQFQSTFKGCINLTSVPVSLFDCNRKVRIFRETFFGCELVTGESPYTMVDSEKVHLYERIYFRDEFKTPVEYDGCFRPFFKLFGPEPMWADYDKIPQSWK